MTGTDEAALDLPPESALRDWIAEVAEMLQQDVYKLKDQDRAEEFLTLFGLCVQAIRYAEAYVSLIDAGFNREAFPLARAAFEHAVTAQWCYYRDTGVARMRVSAAVKQKEYNLAMAEWLGNEQLREKAMRIEVPSGKGMPKYSALQREFEQGGFLDVTYMNLSRATHVTDATITGYLNYSETDGYSLILEPHHPFQYQGLYSAAAGAMLAIDIIAELTGDVEGLARIDAASDRLSLPMSLCDSLDPSIVRTARDASE